MPKLQKVKNHIKKASLGGYLIPMADAFQNEFMPDYYKRIEWLSGFTGSAGFLVITEKESVLFVDGRYTIQADTEVNQKDFQIQDYSIANISKFLAKQSGKKIGFDPWTLTCWEHQAFHKNSDLIPTDTNLIDAVWADQPDLPAQPIIDYPLKYAGESSLDKRQKITHILKENNIDGVVLCRADSIAWLLNLRGNDVDYTPIFLSYAFMDKAGQVVLFCNSEQVDPAVHLKNVIYKSLTDFPEFLQTLKDQSILLDQQKTPYAIYDKIKDQNHIIFGEDPCQLPKAITNVTEQKGARNCQIREGVALTKFLYWLDHHAVEQGADEYAAMEKNLSFRQDQDLFQQLSFGTIAGINENAAPAHYHTTKESNQKFTDGCLFLCDSGGQYLDGTTDTTRTAWVGTKKPPQDLIDNYTRVLKGHIAVATAQFPKGTSGMQLDTLARQPLWDAGLDYGHGTGHGVGCYLGVHDGPQGISKRYSPVPLVPGMLLSNEPGYYKKNHYGIRLENIVMVVPVDAKNSEGEIYGFETLTCVPFDPKLINFDLLNEKEKNWLRGYHKFIKDKLMDALDKEKDWLRSLCNNFVQ